MGILDNAAAQQIQVYQAPTVTGTPTGYDPTLVDPNQVPQVEANGWDANTAEAAQFDNTQQNSLGINGYVSNNLNNLIDENGQYIQLHRQQAAEAANARGLLNSSMAAGWGQRAAIEAAMPIAQADANAFNNVGLSNVGAQNQFSLANQSAQNQAAGDLAMAQNQAEQFNANLQQQTNLSNQQASNQAEQFSATSANEFAARNMDAINRSAELFASASNTAALQDVENQMRLLLANAEEDLSNYSTDIQRKTALDGIASSLVQSGVNAGVFATVEGGANWLRMIGDLYPDMGLSVSDSLSAVASGSVQ